MCSGMMAPMYTPISCIYLSNSFKNSTLIFKNTLNLVGRKYKFHFKSAFLWLYGRFEYITNIIYFLFVKFCFITQNMSLWMFHVLLKIMCLLLLLTKALHKYVEVKLVLSLLYQFFVYLFFQLLRAEYCNLTSNCVLIRFCLTCFDALLLSS
jgi:hypothetical protein